MLKRARKIIICQNCNIAIDVGEQYFKGRSCLCYLCGWNVEKEKKKNKWLKRSVNNILKGGN